MRSTSSAAISALTDDQVKNIGILGPIAVVVIGLLIVKFVSGMIIRLVTLAVVVVLASALWIQRDKVMSEIDKKTADLQRSCDARFFGFHVEPSDPNLKKACDLLDKVTTK